MSDGVNILESKAIIDGKEYRLGTNLRTQVLYEEMIQSVDDKKGVLAIVVYFYAVLLALNKHSFKMEFDTFFDYLDDNPDMFSALFEWSKKDHNLMNYFSSPANGVEKEEETDDKKKD